MSNFPKYLYLQSLLHILSSESNFDCDILFVVIEYVLNAPDIVIEETIWIIFALSDKRSILRVSIYIVIVMKS